MKLFICATILLASVTQTVAIGDLIGAVVGGVVDFFDGFKVPGTDVELLGCYQDGDSSCAVPEVFGVCAARRPPRTFHGGFVKFHHKDVHKKCYEEAVKNNVKTFAIQNGDMCFANDKEGAKHYNKIGKPLIHLCGDGRGGPLQNDVYHIKKATEGYKHIGCWKDSMWNRAVPELDGKDPTLKDPYQGRADAIHKCYLVAKKKGHKIFAVQHGGWCAGSKSTEGYKKYGKATNCKDGKGGGEASDIYSIDGTGMDGDVKLVGKTPYYFYQGDFRPICGHWFWDNNNGATTFCKKLGHKSGTAKKVRGTYDADAYMVGKCKAGEALEACSAGGNDRDLAANSVQGRCKKGHKVSVEVDCEKEPEWTEQVGYCRDCDGKDQNNGAVSSSSTGKADCLAKCRKNPRALACEIHIPSNWCTAYTAKVSQGYPVDKKHICWAPPKNVECLKPELRWVNPPTPAPTTTLPPAKPLSAYLGCWNWKSNAPGQNWGWSKLRFQKDNAVQVMTRVGRGDNWKPSDDQSGVFPASEGWYVLGVNQAKYYMRIMGDGKIHWRKFQIQHSFCKARAYKGKKGYCNDYGTAESYACPTTAPTTMAPKPSGCIDIDTNYRDHDIPESQGGRIKGVKTWQECAKHCANKPACVRFTYVTKAYSNAKVHLMCFMKKDGDLVKLGDRKGLISGPALAEECKADYSFAKNQDNTECSNYSAQDCYREKASFKRHDKKLLIYWRYDITWENIRAFTKSLVCTCAKAAKAAGKQYFAIHFWGECWAMNMDDFRKVNGGDCRRDFDKKCNGNDKRMCFADKDFQVYKTA